MATAGSTDAALQAGTLAVRILSTIQAPKERRNDCHVKSILNDGVAIFASKFAPQKFTIEINDEDRKTIKR